METYPLFSVLIANYNNGKYLMDAISSIKNQTYENWEIVIIDDASTDNSQEIYKELQSDNRIRIYYNENNSGVGYTKRRLCELAKGEIAGFLDADDALVDTALLDVVSVQKSNDYSLVYSTRYMCDIDLNIQKVNNYQMQIPDDKTYLDFSLGRISHFASFRLKYYHQTEGMNPFFVLGEDQDLYFKLEEIGAIKFINKPLYKYRINSNSISSQNNAETIAWGIFAKYEACKRRKLNPAKYISNMIKGEQRIIEFYENSKDYKLGNLILRPFRSIKKIFFKTKL